MRGLRLTLGIIFLIQAFQIQDYMVGAFALFFLFQAISNTGCCGTGRCTIPTNKGNEIDIVDVDFEEIKK
jgi:hypothetical protein